MPATARDLRTAAYLGLQRLRGGVNERQISRARSLLEGSWSDVQRHVRRRLGEQFGPAAAEAEWLEGQPLTERSALTAAVEEASSRHSLFRYEWRKTSGSTGTPFRFVKDRRMAAWMDAVKWAVYAWHGLGPGDRHAQFWGMPPGGLGRLKRQVMDRLLYRRRLSAFEIDQQRSEEFFSRLTGFEPRYFHGYTTLIREFMQHCKAADLDGRKLELDVIICTGEIITPAVREELWEYFGSPVVSEYGCTESGTITFDCEFGTPHTVPVAALAEVVDEGGRPVEQGQAGEVVITDLYGEVMPLLRYRLHDRARYQGLVECGCGRQLPALKIDEGRVDSFIETPHRGRVYDAILAYTVPQGVLRFRAFQTDPDRLEVRIMPGPQFDPSETPARCRRTWEEVLGPGMKVDISVVDDVPLDDSGKLRYFVPLSSSD